MLKFYNFFSLLLMSLTFAFSIDAADTKHHKHKVHHHQNKHSTAKISDRYESYESLQNGLREATGFTQMKQLDDDVEKRVFDNVQFVQLSKIMQENAADITAMEVEFARAALMEIPKQYEILRKKGMLEESYAATLGRIAERSVSKDKDYKEIRHMIKKMKKISIDQ